MPTAYSSLLGLALPVQGELSGVWGDTVNAYITNYLDAAVAGAQTLSTDADVTLTKTTGSALGSTSSQYAILNCTGARTALRTITAPAASKIYVIINQTTGGFGVKLVGSGPTTGITVAAGTKVLAAWNGADFVAVAGASIDLTSQVTGTLPVANGGTGAATLTANNVLLGNGTSAVQVVAPGTSGNVLTSNGTTWQSTALSIPASPIPSGTVMLFWQASAPTGWTQVTTQNNKALRVVSGTGGGTGGTVAFTTAFASQTPAGTVGSTTLSTTQMPSHTHSEATVASGKGGNTIGGGATYHVAGTTTGATGGNGSHNHTFSGTAIDLTVQYIDILIASKN